jgi:NADH-ubiquinone oxidoreductase chain 5
MERRMGRDLLFFLSVLTIFISGLMANFENDLKKIVALSTLRQLGLIIIILRLGYRNIAFYHLLIHALFKSILFIRVGIIIHFILNNQDIRLIGNLNEIIPYTIMNFFISRGALVGFPFIAGFYSKDFIIELIYIFIVNRFIYFLILVSLIMTVSYTFRIVFYLFFSNLKFYRFINIREDKTLNFSILILGRLRIFGGALLN